MVTLDAMSVASLLTRVLLCLALILNGSGFAVAGSHMHMQHGHPAMADNAPVAQSAPAATTSGEESMHLDGDLALADCCTDAAHCSRLMCTVGCAAGSSAPATLPASNLGFRINRQAQDATLRLAGHPTPALRARYRPPIV